MKTIHERDVINVRAEDLVPGMILVEGIIWRVRPASDGIPGQRRVFADTPYAAVVVDSAAQVYGRLEHFTTEQYIERMLAEQQR